MGYNKSLTSEQVILNNVNMANLALNMPESSKLSILHMYESMASEKLGVNSSVIENNKFNYSVILNRTLFLTLLQSMKPLELAKYTNLNNLLNTAIKNNGGNRNVKAFKSLHNDLAKTLRNIGMEINSEAQPSDVQNAITTFGIEQVNPEEIDKDIEDIEDTDFDFDEDELNGLFDNIDDIVQQENETSEENIASEDDMFPSDDEIAQSEGFDTIEEPVEDIAPEAEPVAEPVDNIEEPVEDIAPEAEPVAEPVDNIEEPVEDIAPEAEPVAEPVDTNIATNDDNVFVNKEEKDEEKEDEEKENKRKEELKQGKVSGTASDIEDADNGIDEEELKYYVDNTISNIMGVYSQIYQPLFQNPPKGVLFREESGRMSIMAVGNAETGTGVKVHVLKSVRIFIAPIYQAIVELSGNNLREAPKVGDDGMDIKSSWMNSDGTLKYNYVPHIQVRNCMGVYKDKATGNLKRAKTWSEFKSKLTSELKPTILGLLKRVKVDNDETLKRAMLSIQELYTTIFLVNEFDAEKAFRLTVFSPSLSSKNIMQKIPDAIISANPLNKDLSEYKIMNNDVKNGIMQVLIVTDMDKYRGEINFAYKTLGKIINAGGSIDIAHTVVGNDLSGNPVEINLANNAYVSIGIVAGSRSGKGVLTLSLLAAMIAAKCPVVYLDYKPDMASTFWELERKYGVPTLAIDGQTSKVISGGKTITPVRNYIAGYGVPNEIVDSLAGALNTIPYVKGVQIMNLVGLARVTGKLSKKHKMFFVLDEAQQCSKAIAETTKSLETLRDKNKPKAKEKESDVHKYLVKLAELYSTVSTAATTFLNTNGGLGNMGALVLGQQPDAGEWRGPFSALMLKCPIKFLGNQTVGGSKYGLSAKTPGVEMMGTGIFGLSTSNVPTEDNTKIIKTTMVLNDADFDPQTMQGGTYTGSLLKNITSEEIKDNVINNDMIVSPSNDIAINAGCPVGDVNKLVGFPGLIEFIGNKSSDFDIKSALGAGYREVEKVLNLLGIVGKGCPYDNVEAYMYSAKEDSLFTMGQLNNALSNNMTIYDYLNNGAANAPKDGRIISDEKEKETEPEDDIINMGAGSEQTERMNLNNNQIGFIQQSNVINSNQPQEDPFSSFGVSANENNSQPHVNSNRQDLGTRIISLSQIICRERGWTADQLIEFQNKMLKQMGVQ